MSLSQYVIDKESKTPLYLQVEDIIKDLLLKEPYKSGGKLPNELEITKELNVSRNTVRKAMYALLNKNLILRKKHKGTFKNIDNKPMQTTLNNWYSFNDDMKKQNRDFRIFEHFVSEEKPNSEICEKLGIKSNRKVLKLTRVKGYLEPELVVESYFHPDLDLTKNDLESTVIQKLYYFLESRLDIKIVSSHEEISACAPDNKMKQTLNIKDKNLPLIIRKMLIFDESKNRIAFSIGSYLSNRFVFNLDISR